MNRDAILPWALSLLAAGATIAPARLRAPAAAAAGSPRVGLVFDVGGRGDKSFNDAAYAGLVGAASKYGVSYELAEPAGTEDREAALRLFAARKFDLVIGIGNIFTRDVDDVAREFGGVHFACVDYGASTAGAPNVAGLVFREEEGAFLVGAAAGRETKTGQVGYVGGMTIDLILRFEAGYRAGVAATCPHCVTHVAYAGSTADAFRDPAKGKAIAASQIASGADVIFHAAGATGYGVFEAAREAGVRAIGVDRDQYDEMPGVVMTSLVKRVDTAVEDGIRSVVEHAFAGGVRSFGLAEGGIDWVHEGPHAASMKPSTLAAVEALRADVVAGRVKVPSKP